MERLLDDLVDGVEEAKPLPVTELASATEALPAVQPQHKPHIRVPARHNPHLARAIDRINRDEELWTWWRCANVNAVDRMGLTDHGWVHVQIVANVGLKLLRLLKEGGVQPSVVAHYGLDQTDAEVVVVLAALLHDLGMAIHREEHEQMSPFLALPKLQGLLTGIYEQPNKTIVIAEVLHAMVAHHWNVKCLTIEAGVVKVADALDMAKGRSRIPFEAGSVNIHSVSALAIENVTLQKGEGRPIAVDIAMSNSAGVFQLDELLKRKLQNSSIEPYVEVRAHVTGPEKQLVTIYQLGVS